MPNRILRDWTDSERISQLSIHAERFFTRLIMKADDYGRYPANPKLLKSSLYPLADDVRIADMTRWMAECQKAGLILVYDCQEKTYVQIENFKQQLRQKRVKYPSPKDATHMHSACVADAIPETKRNETKRILNAGQAQPVSSGEVFVQLVNGRLKRKFQLTEEVAKKWAARLKEGFTLDDVGKAVDNAMKDPFHIENGYKYLTAEFFSRSSKLDKFRNVNGTPVTAPRESEAAMKDYYERP